jgi:hypothetical protein
MKDFKKPYSGEYINRILLEFLKIFNIKYNINRFDIFRLFFNLSFFKN